MGVGRCGDRFASAAGAGTFSGSVADSGKGRRPFGSGLGCSPAFHYLGQVSAGLEGRFEMTSESEIQVVADVRELSSTAAELFVSLSLEAARERDLFTVVLAGGSTPKNLYALLADWNEPFRARLPWHKIHLFWGDERHVAADHPDSNYRMVQEAMLERVPIPTENVHRIRSENADAAKAADDYEQVLREFFGLTEGHLPSFDLSLLGMGPDGHTASIFPGTDVINEKSRLVAAPWVKKLNGYRITLTPPVLNNSAFTLLLVSGKEKAETLREALQGIYQPDRFPVQIIKPTNGKLLWLVDREAAGRLHQETGRDKQ